MVWSHPLQLLTSLASKLLLPIPCHDMTRNWALKLTLGLPVIHIFQDEFYQLNHKDASVPHFFVNLYYHAQHLVFFPTFKKCLRQVWLSCTKGFVSAGRRGYKPMWFDSLFSLEIQ